MELFRSDRRIDQGDHEKVTRMIFYSEEDKRASVMNEDGEVVVERNEGC